MVILVAKKAKTDRRSERYKGVTREQFEVAGEKLASAGGKLLGFANEMVELGLDSLPIGGRAELDDCVRIMQKIVRDARGALAAAREDI